MTLVPFEHIVGSRRNRSPAKAGIVDGEHRAPAVIRRKLGIAQRGQDGARAGGLLGMFGEAAVVKLQPRLMGELARIEEDAHQPRAGAKRSTR